jgi:hypothetical protein
LKNRYDRAVAHEKVGGTHRSNAERMPEGVCVQSDSRIVVLIVTSSSHLNGPPATPDRRRYPAKTARAQPESRGTCLRRRLA